jgi:putative ABC transport system permease protein
MPNVPQPPRFAAWLLTRLHPEDTLEEVQGDLEELYAGWFERYGRRRAAVRYGLAVLSVLPPFVKRRRSRRDSYHQPTFFQTAMLRNYLTIAWRNLVRQKVSSFINVLGLAAGMAVPCSTACGCGMNSPLTSTTSTTTAGAGD